MARDLRTRGTSPSEQQDVWVRTIVGWHLAFWLMLAIAALRVVLGDGAGTARAGLVLGLLGVLGAAYVVLGRPASRSREVCRSVAYVVVLILVVAAVIALDPAASFLLFIAYPQIWFFLDDLRHGVIGTVALTVASGAAFLSYYGTSADDLRSVGVSMVVSMLFSLLLGLWIARIIDQSRDRAELIEALESARAQLADAHHAQGVMNERERMAREIHDTLAQGFTSVVMLSQAAQTEVGSNPGAVLERLSGIERTARENLAEARALVAAFSPVALDGTDLSGALHRLADRFGQETQLSVRVEVDSGAAELSRDREVVLLRAAQEALTNVRRHAAARHVVIRLGVVGDSAQVEVSDDGAGFDLGTASGFGLSGMRGRVEQVGGAMAVETSPGHGTAVRVQVPAVSPA